MKMLWWLFLHWWIFAILFAFTGIGRLLIGMINVQ